MDAPFVYLVRFWVNPAGAAAVLRWLDGGHMRDVVAQPGFLWVRRVRLEQNSPEGWPGYLMIYGLESRDALQAYFNGPAPARFAELCAKNSGRSGSDGRVGGGDCNPVGSALVGARLGLGRSGCGRIGLGIAGAVIATAAASPWYGGYYGYGY